MAEAVVIQDEFNRLPAEERVRLAGDGSRRSGSGVRSSSGRPGAELLAEARNEMWW